MNISLFEALFALLAVWIACAGMAGLAFEMMGRGEPYLRRFQNLLGEAFSYITIAIMIAAPLLVLCAVFF